MAKKKQGHYCKVCGCYRANEKFSGKGHAAHICKQCAKLPATERAQRIKENRQPLLNVDADRDAQSTKEAVDHQSSNFRNHDRC